MWPSHQLVCASLAQLDNPVLDKSDEIVSLDTDLIAENLIVMFPN